MSHFEVDAGPGSCIEMVGLAEKSSIADMEVLPGQVTSLEEQFEQGSQLVVLIVV